MISKSYLLEQIHEVCLWNNDPHQIAEALKQCLVDNELIDEADEDWGREVDAHDALDVLDLFEATTKASGRDNLFLDEAVLLVKVLTFKADLADMAADIMKLWKATKESERDALATERKRRKRAHLKVVK
jgi:hypothetical protein